MTKKQPQRTIQVKVNDNINFPIGTTLAVQKYTEILQLNRILSQFKQKGIPLPQLIDAFLTYKLSENMSLTRGSDWINRPDILELFELKPFEQRTLFRAIETIGANYQQIILDLQDVLFDLYDFERTDVNLDWSSLILWGDKAQIGKYGYSRDHRPDKKQITFGITELRKPINIPIGLTIAPGNVNDQTHFQTTFNQVKKKLHPNSKIIFDKGANGLENLNAIIASKMQYLTAKQLNKSDMKLTKSFNTAASEFSEVETGVYGLIQSFPSRCNYLFFSEKLKQEQIASALRKAERQLREAKDIQTALQKGKIPKRFTVNNPLVQAKIEYQTQLQDISELQAFELVKNAAITGREGFFCLTSSEDLTLEEALTIYREKDSVEKIMNSLKNEINIKPLRVWSDNGIYGAVLIGYLAHLIISMIRYDEPKLKNISTKFIRLSLSNLTVTIEKLKNRQKRFILANFDPINQLICVQNYAKT